MVNSHTPRSGRALIECLMALTLIAVAGLAVTDSARALAIMADDASLVAVAQAHAHSLVETALARPCGSGVAGSTTTAAAARVSARREVSVTATLVAVRVLASLVPSPLAHRDTLRVTLGSARPCA